MNNLRITILQADLHWENKEENLSMFSEKITAISEETDLIILPEMFSTGFSMQPEKLAESMNGDTVSWMKKTAKEKNAVITGSFICEEEGKFYNRLVWMRPDGTYSVYNKRHLFSMGDEHNHYTAGKERIIEEVKGWKICPLICYDLRFPVWARNVEGSGIKSQDTVRGDAAFDVLIYIANWPERRAYPWKTLLLARAIENQCYVAGVNRIGKDGADLYYSGDSAVINAKGEIISTLKPHEAQTETVVLSYAELEEFRKQFPVLSDADRFSIEL